MKSLRRDEFSDDEQTPVRPYRRGRDPFSSPTPRRLFAEEDESSPRPVPKVRLLSPLGSPSDPSSSAVRLSELVVTPEGTPKGTPKGTPEGTPVRSPSRHEVLSEGSTGCGVRPPLSATTYHPSLVRIASPTEGDLGAHELHELPEKPMVGKLYRHWADLRREVLMYLDTVETLDPGHVFTPISYAVSPMVHRSMLNGCSLVRPGHTTMAQWLLEDCGEPWNAAMMQALSEAQVVEAFRPVFEGLVRLANAGYAHADVRGPNVLCRPSNGRAVLIDFDRMCPHRFFFTGDLPEIVRDMPSMYPPEVVAHARSPSGRTPSLLTVDTYGLCYLLWGCTNDTSHPRLRRVLAQGMAEDVKVRLTPSALLAALEEVHGGSRHGGRRPARSRRDSGRRSSRRSHKRRTQRTKRRQHVRA